MEIAPSCPLQRGRGTALWEIFGCALNRPGQACIIEFDQGKRGNGHEFPHYLVLILEPLLLNKLCMHASPELIASRCHFADHRGAVYLSNRFAKLSDLQ